MSKQQIVDREAKWAPYAAAGGILAVIGFIVSQVLGSSVAEGATSTLPVALRQIDANSGLVLISGLIGGLGLLALMAPLLYLFRAAQARSPRVNGGLVGLAVLGPLLYAVQYILIGIGRIQVAHDYVSQSAGVGDIFTLSSHLFDDSGLIKLGTYAGGAGQIALVVIIIYTALWATRTGLLTRFTGTLGMALGAATLIASLIAVPALSVWFAYVGFIFLDKTGSKPRPPAWDAGEAVEPPRPGAPPVAAGGGEVIEGDATEIPGVETGETYKDNAARRERAKKRKRKRRR